MVPMAIDIEWKTKPKYTKLNNNLLSAAAVLNHWSNINFHQQRKSY